MSSTVEIPAPAESPPNLPKPSPKKSRKGIGGPKTPLGKRRSRRNSTKDGLRARIVLPDDLARIADLRFKELTHDLKPKGALETLLVRDMATSSAQRERAEALWMLDLQRVTDRAKLCWDFDRSLVAENLGAKLNDDPSRIARALFGSYHGAFWLAERWHGLSALLEASGRLTEDQRVLACNLAAVPIELRDSNYRVPPCDDQAGLAEVIEHHLNELDEHIEKYLRPEEQAQLHCVLAGMTVTEDATSARHRRYVQYHRRAFNKAFDQLLRLREDRGRVGPDVNPVRPVSNANMGMHVNRCNAEADQMLEWAVEVVAEMKRAEKEKAKSEAPAAEIEAPVPQVEAAAAVEVAPEIEVAPELMAAPEFEAPAPAAPAAPAKPRNGSAERRERRARRAREKQARKAAQKRTRKR
jgi:hypothetical protein